MIKTGDKVRFLNEVGGGRVTGFQGRNIVLVEDSDGFEIPMAISDVVVVNSDDYSTGRMVETTTPGPEAPAAPDGMSLKERMRQGVADDAPEEDYDPADREVTFKAPVEERKGGNTLSVYLAFVPVSVKEFSSTRFECYMVNDSNYYVRYTCMTGENGSWQLWHDDEMEPNTKAFIAEIGREELGAMERIAVQMIAYKRDRPFTLKPATEVQFRLDAVKFFKLHCFEPNDFFEQPAMLLTVIENDEQKRPLVIDPKKLRQEMYKKERDDDRKPQKEVRRKGKDEIVVVDLHASEVLDTTAGMSGSDILEYQLKVFRDTLQEYAAKKGQKVIFIHGKGEGVLRHAIIKELSYKYKKYQYQDASFQEYGYGATQVTIR